jgi:hypothetical protein
MPTLALTQQQSTTITSHYITPGAVPTAKCTRLALLVTCRLRCKTHHTSPRSEFWRLSVRMRRGQELKCQGRSIPSYFAIRRDVQHTTGTASQCNSSYVQDLITAQQLLCVYLGLWQQTSTWISPAPQPHYISYNSQEKWAHFFKQRPPVGPCAQFPEMWPLNSRVRVIQISELFTGLTVYPQTKSVAHSGRDGSQTGTNRLY